MNDSTEILGNNGELAEAGMELTDLISGVSIPEPIKKTLGEVFSRLCISAVDIPVAYMEGRAEEIRANSAARVRLTGVTREGIEKVLVVPSSVGGRAAIQYGQKILREKENITKVAAVAFEEVKKIAASSPVRGESTVDQNWLNTFESEACQKSSEEMQYLFGKILAGEICVPSSFSLRTVKLISHIDTKTAHMFQRLASMTVSLRHEGAFIDCRVIAPSTSASQNGLQKYGFTYPDLLLLHECGLIVPEFNTQMNFSCCIAKDNQVAIGLEYNGTIYALVPEVGSTSPEKLLLNGVMLTTVGRQLLSIIDVHEHEEYTNDLKGVFHANKLTLIPVKKSAH